MIHTRTIRLSIALLALLALSGCGRIVKEEVEIGWKGVAKFDCFLAASRFIEKMGITSGSYPRAPQMPPESGTMLFIPAAAMKSEGVFEQMDDWIYAGGNVVYMLEVEDEGEYWFEEVKDSPIQDFIDYEEIELKDEYELNQEEDSEDKNEDSNSISFGEGEQFKEEYKTGYPSSFVFRFTPEEEGDDEDYYHFDSYSYGEGSVTIISTGVLFTNKYLDKAEHATLLWDLVKWYNPSEVQFIFSSNQSFWALLWKHASYALVTLALLLFVWIWFSVKRFGPLFNTVQSSENKLDEHLTSTGYFFAEHKADTLIINQLREDLRISLARRVNLPINAELPQILDECQKHEILNASQIELMRTPYPDNSKDQIAFIQKFQKIQP